MIEIKWLNFALSTLSAPLANRTVYPLRKRSVMETINELQTELASSLIQINTHKNQ